MRTEQFSFEYNGNRLVGVLDWPNNDDPTSVIVFVHGHGRSNPDRYHDLRKHFSQHGLACCIWDKAGCGQSSGEYDHGQTVQSSAYEVVAGIDALTSLGITGQKRIGLWGISRAGWICPLVITEQPSVAFWISVSGPNDQENYRYLLETNLRIEGRSESEVTELIAEWQRGYEALQKGVPYHEFLELTRTVRQDPFYGSISVELTEEAYRYEQARFVSGEYTVDGETGLMVYVPGFHELLSKINCPVLAIFGEKDTNVDWRKSLILYRDTLGSCSGADLTIKTFPAGNHGIYKCQTGGVRESVKEHCDGYFEVMTQWLVGHGFGI